MTIIRGMTCFQCQQWQIMIREFLSHAHHGQRLQREGACHENNKIPDVRFYFAYYSPVF